MRCETALAILESEGLALVSVSPQRARELVRAFQMTDLLLMQLASYSCMLTRKIKYQLYVLIDLIY